MSERLRRLWDRLTANPGIPVWRRLGWPVAVALAWGLRYGMESLRHRREGRRGYEARDPAPPSSDEFQRASEALTGHAVVAGNRATALINGDRIFPAMLDAIRSATETINLETYVYWQGEIATELARAVCERAAAGVECRLLLDAVGSARMRPALIRELRDAGATVVRFRPPQPRLIARVANRSHRRVLVVDGRIGFTGGVGIAEEWTGDAEDAGHWRDTHLRVEGPAVHALQGAFAEHWVEATGEALVGGRMLPETEPAADGTPMQIVRSGARVGDTSIEILFYLAIASAESTLDITSAYFVPRPPFVAALVDASSRGVKVRILVPGPHADKDLVRLAGRDVYEALLEGGVELHEYQPTMLHAKAMVVDRCWSSVGTVNFDNRSFQRNDELTVCVFGRGMAAELTDAFEHDLSRSEPIELDRWRSRGLLQRAGEKLTVPARREL